MCWSGFFLSAKFSVIIKMNKQTKNNQKAYIYYTNSKIKAKAKTVIIQRFLQ